MLPVDVSQYDRLEFNPYSPSLCTCYGRERCATCGGVGVLGAAARRRAYQRGAALGPRTKPLDLRQQELHALGAAWFAAHGRLPLSTDLRCVPVRNRPTAWFGLYRVYAVYPHLEDFYYALVAQGIGTTAHLQDALSEKGRRVRNNARQWQRRQQEATCTTT